MLRGSPNRVKQNRLAPRTIVESHGKARLRSRRPALHLVWRPNSSPRAPTVLDDCLLEVLVFLARNQADLVQGGQVLLGFRQVVDDEIGFADVFVRAAMPRIALERAPVVLEGEVHLAGVAIRVAKMVLDVGIPRIAE